MNTQLLERARAECPFSLGAGRLLDENGLYCAVGYLLHMAGLPDNEIHELDLRDSTCHDLAVGFPSVEVVAGLYGLNCEDVDDLLFSSDGASDEGRRGVFTGWVDHLLSFQETQ